MLYTIGDLHLSFGADKPMDVFGPEWENHAERLKENFKALGADDVTVIAGDLTWGMELRDCLEDFRFINALPGRKIILKGNHDLWWSTATAAMRFFRENGLDTIEILNNNCYFYGETAICGTRGWFCPAENASDHDKKIMAREVIRLEASLKAAGDADDKVVFLHYPPFYGKFYSREMVALLHAYGVRECYYGHIHGSGRRIAFEGTADGIAYRLISADNVGFAPVRVR